MNPTLIFVGILAVTIASLAYTVKAAELFKKVVETIQGVKKNGKNCGDASFDALSDDTLKHLVRIYRGEYGKETSANDHYIAVGGTETNQIGVKSYQVAKFNKAAMEAKTFTAMIGNPAKGFYFAEYDQASAAGPGKLNALPMNYDDNGSPFAVEKLSQALEAMDVAKAGDIKKFGAGFSVKSVACADEVNENEKQLRVHVCSKVDNDMDGFKVETDLRYGDLSFEWKDGVTHWKLSDVTNMSGSMLPSPSKSLVAIAGVVASLLVFLH